MRRSTATTHRLISRTSELFADEPELTQFVATGSDMSAPPAASQSGKAELRTDRKSRCNVLFGGMKEKQVHKSAGKNPVPHISSDSATQVSCDFLLLIM